jgi:hypothetical protein
VLGQEGLMGGSQEMFRLIAIAVICTMLLIPIAGFSSNIISNGPLLAAVSFGLAYLVVPAFLLHIWPAQKRRTVSSMQDALLDGELVTVEHGAREIVQIEEAEDEGLHFLVATESGQTLFLSGQYLYGLVERRTFPSERLRAFGNRVTGLSYGIEPVGRPLAAWPVYASFTSNLTSSQMTLEDGKLYAQTIAAIVAEFGLQPVKAPGLTSAAAP